MRNHIIAGVITLLGVVWTTAGLAHGQAKPEAQPGGGLNQSEELAKKYLDGFRESGVPTPGSVDAALKQAESKKTIEAWQMAAKLANSYANVVDVLCAHYSKLFSASRSGSGDGNMAFISTAADYETKRNVYLGIRNAAYLRIARLYLGQGDKAQALSFAVTSVELSGSEPNLEGEVLIRQIIEYKP